MIGGDVRIMTNDKTRFTFRIPKDIDNYIQQKAEQWKSTKTAALIRILNEYSQEYPISNYLKQEPQVPTGTCG